MLRSKCWKFIIILLTAQCEIYVRTSQIQGEGGCKRLLIYFKVDPLRPSSQFSVDYTGFKTDWNKQRAKFQENFEVHEAGSRDALLARAGQRLLTNENLLQPLNYTLYVLGVGEWGKHNGSKKPELRTFCSQSLWSSATRMCLFGTNFREPNQLYCLIASCSLFPEESVLHNKRGHWHVADSALKKGPLLSSHFSYSAVNWKYS